MLIQFNFKLKLQEEAPAMTKSEVKNLKLRKEFKGMKKNALVVRLEEMQSSKSTAPKLNWNALMVEALLKLRLWRQIPGN